MKVCEPNNSFNKQTPIDKAQVTLRQMAIRDSSLKSIDCSKSDTTAAMTTYLASTTRSTGASGNVHTCLIA
jgi:hypothetical protein